LDEKKNYQKPIDLVGFKIYYSDVNKSENDSRTDDE